MNVFNMNVFNMNVFNINEFDPVIYKGRKILGGTCVEVNDDSMTIEIPQIFNGSTYPYVNYTNAKDLLMIEDIKYFKFTGVVHLKVEGEVDLGFRQIIVTNEQPIFINDAATEGLLKKCIIDASYAHIYSDTPMERVSIYTHYNAHVYGLKIPRSQGLRLEANSINLHLNKCDEETAMKHLFPSRPPKNIYEAISKGFSPSICSSVYKEFCEYVGIPIGGWNKPPRYLVLVDEMENAFTCFEE